MKLGEWCGAVKFCRNRRVEDCEGRHMWAVILTNRGISAEVPNCILWDMDFFLLLPASDMPLLWKSLFDMRNILHEGPHEKARPICRQENGSLHDPPMETSFGHWNMSLLLQDKYLIIGRIS